MIVPPLVGVEIAPVNVTKFPPTVGKINAPLVSVVTPVMVKALFVMVTPPVPLAVLLIVKAATVAGNIVPVTCEAVPLKVKEVVVGKVTVPLAVIVPLTPERFDVVNDPLAEWVKLPVPFTVAEALAMVFKVVSAAPVPLKSRSWLMVNVPVSVLAPMVLLEKLIPVPPLA